MKGLPQALNPNYYINIEEKVGPDKLLTRETYNFYAREFYTQ